HRARDLQEDHRAAWRPHLGRIAARKRLHVRFFAAARQRRGPAMKHSHEEAPPVEILLVEDNPGDYRLTQEALREGKVYNNLHWAKDGVEAREFLHQSGKFADSPRPDIILLDLNLPKKDGREVLSEIKRDEALRPIPVVILTTSQAEEDVLR